MLHSSSADSMLKWDCKIVCGVWTSHINYLWKDQVCTYCSSMGLSSGVDLHCMTIFLVIQLDNKTQAECIKCLLVPTYWRHVYCVQARVLDIIFLMLTFYLILSVSSLEWCLCEVIKAVFQQWSGMQPSVSSLSLIRPQDEQPSITEFIFSLSTELHYSPSVQHQPCYRLPHTPLSVTEQYSEV